MSDSKKFLDVAETTNEQQLKSVARDIHVSMLFAIFATVATIFLAISLMHSFDPRELLPWIVFGVMTLTVAFGIFCASTLISSIVRFELLQQEERLAKSSARVESW